MGRRSNIRSNIRQTSKPDRRHMLELIDGCGPNGMPEATMEAHGFTIPDMVELVRSGLAAAICERVVEDRLKVTRVRLTEAGRRLLEKAKR
jgi:hypothetical protein